MSRNGDGGNRGGDQRWASVLDEVRRALDDAKIEAGTTRELLVDGVREALESLSEIGLVTKVQHRPAAPATDDPPEVTVVEGGRSEDEPPTAGEAPNLRVADPAHDPGAGAARDGGEHPSAPTTTVKVIRRLAEGRQVNAGERPARRTGLTRAGWIVLEAPDLWQTVFRGDQPRAYRVACIQGKMRISLDGIPADALAAGQSMDVEARLIRVCGDEGPARGEYVRLRGRDSSFSPG